MFLWVTFTKANITCGRNKGKKTLIGANVGTFLGEEDLYGLGKLRTSLSREFYQFSYGMEDILGKGSENEKQRIIGCRSSISSIYTDDRRGLPNNVYGHGGQ